MEFINGGDEEVKSLAAQMQSGDQSAMDKLQDKFVAKNFPGISLKAIKDNDMIAQDQAFLAQDTVLQSLIKDQEGLDILLNPNLRFPTEDS
jgi:hypothetical protein